MGDKRKMAECPAITAPRSPTLFPVLGARSVLPSGVVVAVCFPVKVASLPFRFKADAKMPGAVGGGHSHRATTKVSHKPFKSRKATKGQLRDAAKGMTHAGFRTLRQTSAVREVL
jgi:hypothetical protein